MSTSTKVFLAMQKFDFSSKLLDGATQYELTNSLSRKTSSPIINSSFPF